MQNSLLKEAEEFLIKLKVILPTNKSLGRKIAKIKQESLIKIYEKISKLNTEKKLKKYDKLLKSKGRGSFTEFFKFKQSAPEATAKVINEYLDRLSILLKLKVHKLNFEDIDQELIISIAKYAFNLVSEYLNDGSPVTESLIREIHKKLVYQVRGNTAAPGEYRKIQNYVVNSKTQEIIYTPPPAYEIGIMMQELIEYINKVTDINDIIISGIAQFQLVHIHPFLDGNGRTARLLSTLCLYKKGYDFKKLFTLSEYYDRNRLKYYEAIQSVRNNDMDMTEWLEYFIHALASQISEIQ